MVVRKIAIASCILHGHMGVDPVTQTCLVREQDKSPLRFFWVSRHCVYSNKRHFEEGNMWGQDPFKWKVFRHFFSACGSDV